MDERFFRDAEALLRPANFTEAHTVETYIQRAIDLYGPDAVKKTVQELTKSRRGRREENDWPYLRNVFIQDAIIWLRRGDPLGSCTNYRIAAVYAANHSGQSPNAVHSRIERKLTKKPHDRRWYVQYLAIVISRNHFPYQDHLRAIKAMILIEEEERRAQWEVRANEAHAVIKNFTDKFGHPPDHALPLSKIELECYDLLSALNCPPMSGPTRSLFGLLPPSNPLKTEDSS